MKNNEEIKMFVVFDENNRPRGIIGNRRVFKTMREAVSSMEDWENNSGFSAQFFTPLKSEDREDHWNA